MFTNRITEISGSVEKIKANLFFFFFTFQEEFFDHYEKGISGVSIVALVQFLVCSNDFTQYNSCMCNTLHYDFEELEFKYFVLAYFIKIAQPHNHSPVIPDKGTSEHRAVNAAKPFAKPIVIEIRPTQISPSRMSSLV